MAREPPRPEAEREEENDAAQAIARLVQLVRRVAAPGAVGKVLGEVARRRGEHLAIGIVGPAPVVEHRDCDRERQRGQRRGGQE
jgi:hypothetical protein